MPRKGKRGAGLLFRRKSNKARKTPAPVNELPIAEKKPDKEKKLPNIDEVISSDEEDTDDEDIVPYYSNIKYEALNLKITSTALRYGIMVLFVNKYSGLNTVQDGDDLQSTWAGRGGLISKIKRDLGLQSTHPIKIRPILMDIVDCARCGRCFDPNFLEQRGGNKAVVIKSDSVEAQIIADGLESGLSVERTRQILNNHALDEGNEGFTRSAVDSLVTRLKPRIEKVTKRKQGSIDPKNPWSRARLLWSKQLLIRFGEMPSETTKPAFNRELAGPLHLDQVVWWDETHRKCLIGGLTTNRNFTIKFKRDNEGKLDMRNGHFCDKKVQILNCKYEKECRLGLGCAMVTPRGPIEGSFLPIIGKRCLPFDYSEKVLLSVSDYEKKMEAEFRRIKSLSAKTGYWIESTREEGKLYCDDKVTVLKKVGKKVGQKLENAQFTVLSDLKKVTDPDAVTVDGITKKSFRSLWEQAQLSSVDASPQPIDHRKSPNPYQSKFGDRWEDHLKNQVPSAHQLSLPTILHL